MVRYKVEIMSIIAVTTLRIFADELRTVCVKEGAPIEIAYNDNNDSNWTVVRLPIDKDDYVLNNNCLLVLKNDRFLYLATAKGYILSSRDGGETWTVLESGIYFNTPYKLLIFSNDRIIAVNENGMIFSNDYGYTWKLMQKTEWTSYDKS